jgi:hypothetical protein
MNLLNAMGKKNYFENPKEYKSSKAPTKSHTIIMTNVWH